MLRAVAVILMVAYHALFDLTQVDLVEVDLYSTGLELAADGTAITFFGLVGLSLYISFSRRKAQGLPRSNLNRKYLLRGSKIFLLGCAVTLVTSLLYPEAPILFGALHFIGTSIIMGFGILVLTERTNRTIRPTIFLVTAVLFWVTSSLTDSLTLDTALLLPFGVTPEGFQSLDYFPLVPWFGFVALGLSLGPILYPGGKRRFAIPDFTNVLSTLVGRHALIIYVLHQPLLYGAILAFRQISR